jgi:organic hydroperoxide reductase OsmC/OhrA
MSTHNAVVEWTLEDGTSDSDFLAGRYSRGHTIGFDGGVTLPASSSPAVVRKPWSVEAAADPEELLVASASSCHMLWFLDLAKHAGFVVHRYHDEPEGLIGKFPDGRVGLVKVALRPLVTFAGAGPSTDTLDRLHHQAHEACFIANSLRGEVVVEAPVPVTV